MNNPAVAPTPRDAPRWFYVWMAGACARHRRCGLCADLLAAAARRERSSARRSFICTARCSPRGPLFSAPADDVRGPAAGRPSSRLGPPRHLARDRHGAGRLRGRERGPGETAGGRLRRPRARLPHRVDVDDRALRRVRLRRHRLRQAAGDPQATDAAGDDLDAPAGDRATVLRPDRGDGPRSASGSRTAANRGVGAGSRRSSPTRSSSRAWSTTCARAAGRIPPTSSAARSCSPSRFCACP